MPLSPAASIASALNSFAPVAPVSSPAGSSGVPPPVAKTNTSIIPYITADLDPHVYDKPGSPTEHVPAKKLRYNGLKSALCNSCGPLLQVRELIRCSNFENPNLSIRRLSSAPLSRKTLT